MNQDDERPRVLHVMTRFAAGGSEQRLIDLVTATPELRHIVIVGELSAAQRWADLTAEPVVLPTLQRALAPANDLRALLQLIRALRTVRPAVLVTHQSKASALGRLAGRLTRYRGRTIQSLSMSALDEAGSSRERAVFRVVERALGRGTDMFICVGDDLAAQYQRELGLGPERFEVVRSTVRLDAFTSGSRAEARAALSLDDTPMVLYVGSFEERKGVRLLPTIAKSVAASVGRLTLALVGDGPAHNDVVAAATALDDIAVLAPGHVSDVATYMLAADVLCLPSRAEGLPQVLVQAASCGLPFVAFDVSGVGELLRRGARGASVPLGDAEAMAASVAGVLHEGASASPAVVDLGEWDPPFVHRRYHEILHASVP